MAEEKVRKGLSKADKGRFRVGGIYEMVVTGDKGEVIDRLEIPIKSLPVNIGELVNEILPDPEPPQRFDKRTKAFVPDHENPEHQKELAKNRVLKTYAVALMGIDQEKFPIEGDDILEKIKTLIETEIPAGYFSELVSHLMRISNIDEDDFRKGV